MKHNTPLGSRIAEVHNGSSLFTGDAGQGESNIRQWIIENDWLEAIIALPENMFYNTGIATYIWVLSNRKPEHRKGKVQLIDATQWYASLRKNLGKKNCEFSEEHIKKICDLSLSFKESEQSKIFPNEAFGYWKVTVERPLRLKVDLSPNVVKEFGKKCQKMKDKKLADIIEQVAGKMGSDPHLDFNTFMQDVELVAEENKIKLKANQVKLLTFELAVPDESAQPVIKKNCETNQPNPLYGMFETKIKGKKCIVEYESDTNLRDTEQVPLLENGGIETFFNREVLPYVPDAWIDDVVSHEFLEWRPR